MDLKVRLKCVLSFILCIWRGENVKSMECEMGDVIQKPDVSLQCEPLTGPIRVYNVEQSKLFEMKRIDPAKKGNYDSFRSTLLIQDMKRVLLVKLLRVNGFGTFLQFKDLRGTLKKNCQFFSCKQNETVAWKIIDPKKGTLRVQLQNLPKSCNFEWYDMDLEVYDEREPYKEALMCDTGNSPWRTHSRRTLENSVCSNCSSFLEEDCVQVYTAIFRYVYPGFYRVKVTPYENGGTRQAQRSYRINVNSTVTYYVQKKFTDLNLNASLQYRSSKRELDLGIPLLIEDAPDAVKVDLKFSPDFIHFYGIKYGNENSSSIKCQEPGKLSIPSCRVQNAGLECKFFKMSPGFYVIHVHFIDDRCKRGTVWANQYSDPCHWIIRKNFTVDGAAAEAVIPDKESLSPEIIFTIILIVILIGVIIVSFIAKKVTWRRRTLGNGIIKKASEGVRKTNAEQTYNFNNGHANRFNFGQLLTLSERPRPEVLLVYTRETPPFMDLVACLRGVLDKICKCKVYDYFDSELWNDVSEDPRGWVYTLIVERQAKVIIIASEVAAIRHRSLMGEFPERSYKSPHPFDHLFLYALRLLRDGMDEDSYKNHFVVTFDGFTESNHLLEYFNPYMRFILPKHLNKLFEHLHDPDTTIHFDTNKLEERYEVRQLRLQLEHLKNLKLLAKSDVDSRKLYDW